MNTRTQLSIRKHGVYLAVSAILSVTGLHLDLRYGSLASDTPYESRHTASSEMLAGTNNVVDPVVIKAAYFF